MTKNLLSLAFAMVALVPATALAAPQYGVRTLTPSGGDFLPASIAGDYVVGNGTTDAGSVSLLQGPGGTTSLVGPAGYGFYSASGVNRLGTVVGTGGNGQPPRGMIWRGAVGEVLANSDSNTFLVGSRALAINDSGLIVGQATTELGDVAVVWNGTDIQTYSDLDPTAEYHRSSALAVNASGQIAGSAAGFGTLNAVVWEGGVARVVGGASVRSAAAAINDLGVAVGYGEFADGTARAFMNDGTSTTFLADLAGAVSADASGINNAGLIVGSSSFGGFSEGVATLWQDGQAYDLNSLLGPSATEWNLVSATGISDNGTIVGFGYHNGEFTSFQLNPVPEPASMMTLGAGLVALARRRRARA